jgi:hypothetical protein
MEPLPANPHITLSDIESELEIEKRLLEIKQSNMKMYLQLRKTVGIVDKESVFAITEHKYLLRRVLKSRFYKFANIADAIVQAELNKEHILVHFTELGLYGVTDIETYHNFVQNVRDDIEDYDISYKPAQVVLESWQQKVIFYCCMDTKEAIVEHAKTFFKSDVQCIDNGKNSEITVNILADNNARATQLYHDFMNYVNKASKKDYENANCRMPPMLFANASKEKYFNSVLPPHSEINDFKELGMILKAGSILNVVVAGRGHLGTIIINNVNKNDPSSPIDWVKQNPPVNRQTNSDYHNKYIKSGGNMSIAQFGRMVKASGYTSKHSGNIRYYVI